MIFQAMTAAVLAALLPTTALAQIADIRSYSSVPPENLTSIMVLGTPHLSALEDVTPSHVKTVVDQIVAAKARVIGIERLSALEIVTMQASPLLAPAHEQFVGPTLLKIAAAAQSRTGMGALEAAEVTSAWTSGSAGLTQEECLERLDIALAAYQPETALLYRERIAANALDQDAAHYLDTQRTSMNERVSVALAAAGRLDLAKLWSIDSHLDKRLILPRMKELQAAFAKAPPVTQMPHFVEQEEITDRAIAKGDLLPLYCHINAQSFGAADVRGQFDLPNRLEFEGDMGRIREAAWDERNHRIAAHVRHASASAVGGAMVVLIGVGHKPFLDELLLTSLDSTTQGEVLACD